MEYTINNDITCEDTSYAVYYSDSTTDNSCTANIITYSLEDQYDHYSELIDNYIFYNNEKPIFNIIAFKPKKGKKFTKKNKDSTFLIIGLKL